MTSEQEEEWRELAACNVPGRHTTHLFYNFSDRKDAYNRNKAERENSVEALRICGNCEVRDACYDFAIRTMQKDGVWGGTLPQERRKVWRDAKMAARRRRRLDQYLLPRVIEPEESAEPGTIES